MTNQSSQCNELLSPLEVCGHAPDQGNMCRLLCDDFVSKTPGLCYLMAFQEEGRRSIKDVLGLFPLTSQVMSYYLNPSVHKNTVHVTPPLEASGILHFRVDSIPSQEPTTVSVGECLNCGINHLSYLNSLRPKTITDCRHCGEAGTSKYVTICTVRFTYYANRIGSDLPISNLIKSEPTSTGFEFRDPVIYQSSAVLPMVSSTVSLDDDYVTITIGAFSVKYHRTDQALKAFVHDFVANKWQGTTDRPLSLLGVEGYAGNLTPDFLIPGTKCVLELGTCNSDNQRALMNMWEDKAVKYIGELRLVDAKYFIVIVSPQHVVTNTDISQSFVDELTIRMRTSIVLKDKVVEVLGEDIFDDEYSEVERLVRHVFSKVPEPEQIADKYFYNLKELERIKAPLTRDESISAAKILADKYDSTRTIHTSSKDDMDRYLMKFTPDNSRSDLKRISNLPLMLPGFGKQPIVADFEGNDTLREMWQQLISSKSEVPKVQSLESVLANQDPTVRHGVKKSSTVRLTLTTEQQEQIAVNGIGGKKFKENTDVKQHQAEAKKSFHPYTCTDDIEDFLKRDLLEIDEEENRFMPYLLKRAVELTKDRCCPDGENKSVDIWNKLLKTDLMKYSMMMSQVFLELSYCYKHWTSQHQFIYKQLECGIEMMIYNPKSAIFVSFAFPKIGSYPWDTGRLGPTMYSSSTHYFSDWSSFDDSQLEHFVKFGPYMGSCLIELLSSSESSIEKFSKYARDCAGHILLLYLNNKTDVEELITSQRYLIMKVLEDVGSSPWVFVDRFPKVFRSRLTCYYFKKTLDLMHFYETNKISKIPRQGQEIILYDYLNIRSLFSTQHISLSMKVNEFYFGYVISKERNTGKDKTFKVLSKLIKCEQKFRNQVHGSIFTQGTDYEEFKTNMPLIKFFSKAFSDLLVGKFGPDYKKKILQDFTHGAARDTFSELATLKVSARDHSKDVEVKLGGESTEKIYQEISKMYPEEILKRPYCMESITQLIKEYEEDTKTKISHVSQLAPWCLKKLLIKGYFDSDQFNKSQHGGEREIHVLEIKARVVQFYVEKISRVICSYFPSETTVNPKTKETFVKDHYRMSRSVLGEEFVTVSKSADATTWCQFHHTSHFAAMLVNILPEELTNFVISALSLWPRKRMSFPLKQASSLAANIHLHTDNSTYMQFKTEFNKGTGMFTSPRSNNVEVISGMFQGILHSTSSLYHVMIQEVMKQMVITICNSRLGIKDVVVSVVEGSDDSGKMISVKGKPSPKLYKRLKRLLLWKERVSPLLSVFCNEAKSSIGTHDLIEYNSEWSVRHMTIKPTFRWVTAAQSLSVTERFIDRFRIYNNMITDCLTGGASTLECSVIQLFQCTMHYMLMGVANQNNKELVISYIEMLMKDPNPMHGFFPLDEDVACGVLGVEYTLHRLYKTTSFGKSLKFIAEADVGMDLSPEDLPSWMKSKDLSSVRLKFSNMRLFYKVLERMNLEPLSDAISAVDKDPEILFSKSNSWSDEQHNLVLKVYSKGVKESISNRSSMLRMASASAYLLSNRCFSLPEPLAQVQNLDEQAQKEIARLRSELKGTKLEDKETLSKIKALESPLNKHTLLSIMAKYATVMASSVKDTSLEPNLFPFYREYNKIYSDMQNLKKSGVVVDQLTKRTSKAKILVIEKPVDEVDVIDMCKRHWFAKGRVPYSRGQFKRKWDDLVKKLEFLSPLPGVQGFRETCKNLNMTVVQAKMFLESLSLRARSVVLYDSHARGGSLIYSLSRIYWPNKKILLPESDIQDELSKLRSNLFSILSFWFTKSKKDFLVKKELKNSIVLEKSWTELPSHGLRLKVIAGVLRGVPNEFLIERLEATKRGLLGTYTQQQSGFGKNRKGPGTWQGSICGINVMIKMHDNFCKSIEVSSLHDTVSLGMQLNQFMNDASLEMPKNPTDKTDRYTTNCWLNHEGRIIVSREPKGVPIYQNENLRGLHLDETISMHWFVDTHNSNIRIRARNQKTKEVFTIMSETITSKDWIPGIPASTEDMVYRQWQMGTSVNLVDFNSILERNFPLSRSSFAKNINLINEGKYQNKQDWDFKFMQAVLRDNFRIGMKLDTSNVEIDEVVVQQNVLDDFRSMLDTQIDAFDLGLEQEWDSWAEEVEYEAADIYDMWGIELGDAEEELLQETMNMFSEMSKDQFYELVDYQDMKKNYKMPAANRFFSSLEQLNMIMNKEPMQTSIQNNRHAEGLLGIILTVANGKYSIGKDEGLSSEIIELEDEIMSISSTLSRPGALLRLSLDEIRVAISNIKDQIEHADVKIKARLNRVLMQYLDREEEILTRIDPHLKDIVMLNSESIYGKLKTYMDENSLTPQKWLDDDMSDAIFKAVVCKEVSRCNELTESEKEEAILYLSTRTLNRGVLQSVGIVFNITIKLEGELINKASDSVKPLPELSITLDEKVDV